MGQKQGVSGGGQGPQGARDAEGGTLYTHTHARPYTHIHTHAHTSIHTHTCTQALPRLSERETFSIINDLLQERNGLDE